VKEAGSFSPRGSGVTTNDVRVRTLAVTAAIFLMAAAFILTKTGRDALYLQGRGLYDLPFAYMGIAVLAVPTAFSMLAAIKHLGPRRARVVTPLAAAAMLAAFQQVARPGGGAVMTLFFMLVPLVFGVLFSVSWLLAADLLEGTPRPDLARAYGRIGAGSILGALAGGLSARALASTLDPRGLILVGAAALAASAVVMALAQRSFAAVPLQGAGGGETRVVFRSLFRERYPALLLVTGMTAALVGVLIEFQFYLAAATAGSNTRENVVFFANTYLALNGAGLLVQLFLMPRLQRAVGVHGSLMVLPGSLLAAAAAVLTGGGLAVRSVLRITEGGLRSSIHRVNWEQAYLPLAGARRPAAKVLVDGAGARVAEGLAAVLLYAWLHVVVAGRPLQGRDTSEFTWLLLGALLLWVGLTYVLGRSLQQTGAAEPSGEAARVDIPLPDT